MSANSESPFLVVNNIYKSFDGQPLLRGIALEIAQGEIACLLGPSGSGKSTLLRIIAGLEHADSGGIIFEGNALRDTPTHLRGIGLMFQDLALFPHRNVFDNVAFGLRMQRLPRAEITARVRAMLELVGLADLGARPVHNLSGGEQQRVALARALAPRPRLLMFDEPLGALDRILREELQEEVRAILKRVGMTALYVTHDQNEAFAVADRVLIIHAGIIAQSGTPRELHEHPKRAFVARFLGLGNLLDGIVAAVHETTVAVRTPEGVFTAPAAGLEKGARVAVLIRPHAAEEFAPNPRENVISGTVVESRFHGDKSRVTIETARGARLVFESRGAWQVGQTLQMRPRLEVLPIEE